MVTGARILRAFENLEVGFSNLAKNMKIDGDIKDNDYLRVVVFEEVKKLQNLIKVYSTEEEKK